MATVNVNVRIDAELKQSADEAMQIAGTTPTQAKISSDSQSKTVGLAISANFGSQ
ncbi:hypothetical protein [Candidatus Pantoea floridensis]|uniref:Uncharacterized protein n=1 Tax=Candidatus Pantoea floridensis TaxID=1938870 RepID=A0A286DS73_9GAMM|nr:hypothetical protein [Pantoea floridensis]PIF06852.1 hypothetical protein BX596_5150 [Enterobacteriaceae bacterium JKS000233]SOD61501.1 hypothetical protein SAMN06273570_5167 [Pantoea floridensis]